HAGTLRATGDGGLLRTVLLPLLSDVAEAAGGIDWADDSFARVYAAFERTLFGKRRTYAAVAPLTGLSLAVRLELGDGLCIRLAAAGELAAHWPEASGLLPAGFGREPDRLCVLEVERTLGARAEAPDAASEGADAVRGPRPRAAPPAAP